MTKFSKYFMKILVIKQIITIGAFENQNGTTKIFIIDPKRIQRRLRINHNSHRQLRTLKMAPIDREMEKIQSSKNSVKTHVVPSLSVILVLPKK
jgi:hypothetical protein